MLGALVKLVFLSSAIHQVVFVAFSSLPFAVGELLAKLALHSLLFMLWPGAPAAG